MPERIPRKIAIVSHSALPEACEGARLVSVLLNTLGAQVSECPLPADEGLQERLKAGEFDAVIALGGDGTVLRAGRLCAPLGVPLLGINVGHFGFLAEIHRDQWRQWLPQLMEGRYRLEKRMLLRAEHWSAGKFHGAWDVLNEVVVCRGQYVRPIELHAHVDGYPLATYIADGLIAATPTGSTAYALAVGGPILPPESRSILIIPVAPHLSLDRAVVLPEGASVTISAHTRHEAVFSVDGQPSVVMSDGDEVRAWAGEQSVSFIRFQDPGYFYRNLTQYMEQNPTTGTQP